jgi:hypothetical protein
MEENLGILMFTSLVKRRDHVFCGECEFKFLTGHSLLLQFPSYK